MRGNSFAASVPNPLLPAATPVWQRLKTDVMMPIAELIKITANKYMVPLVFGKDDDSRVVTHLPSREQSAQQVQANCRDRRGTFRHEQVLLRHGQIVLHSSEPID